MWRNIEKISVAVTLMMLPTLAFAMSSSSYQINWDNINAGGTDFSSSASYQLHDSFSDISGDTSSANYQLRQGYRQAQEENLLLTLFISTQDDDTQTAYTAFSNGGLTVTVASTTGLAIGDEIAVVENEGGGQLVAVGEITNIAALVVTVDKWSGDNGSMSASPAGGDDYVYELIGSSAKLGVLLAANIETSVTMAEVTTNAPDGFTVQISEDTDLINGDGGDIDDVSDGTVTAGSEEYGVSTTGDNAAGSGDFSITSTRKDVASSATYGSLQRSIVVYQASIDSGTDSGFFSHTVSYMGLANF